MVARLIWSVSINCTEVIAKTVSHQTQASTAIFCKNCLMGSVLPRLISLLFLCSCAASTRMMPVTGKPSFPWKHQCRGCYLSLCFPLQQEFNMQHIWASLWLGFCSGTCKTALQAYGQILPLQPPLNPEHGDGRQHRPTPQYGDVYPESVAQSPP